MPTTTALRELPRIERALTLGGSRQDWERIFDESASYLWDDATLRVLESEGLRCMPAHMGGFVARPHVFRSLFRKNLGASVSDVWIDASNTTLDGGTGKTGAFVDYVDSTHSLTQAVSAKQCAVPASGGAGFSSALVSTFVAASVMQYISNRAATAWQAAVDGLGMHTFHVLAPVTLGTQIWCSTGDSTRYQHNYSAAGNNNAVITNGGTAIVAPVGAATFTAGTPTYVGFYYQEGRAGNEYGNYSRGTLTDSGDSTLAPAVGAPNASLSLGALNNGALPANMRYRAMYFFHRVLSDAERVLVQQFIQRDTGLTP